MALVIRSWAVNAKPDAGQPHVRIVGRESGILSFILSLLNIEATTTLVVNSRHIEYERGSLDGLRREITTMEHVATTFYGMEKPLKRAIMIAAFFLVLGFYFMGQSTGSTVFGTIVLMVGLGVAVVYYVLNRELTLGFRADSGQLNQLKFKRSIIEGNEINEETLQKISILIEYLIKPTGEEDLEIVTRPVSPSTCPGCGTPITAQDVFCASCGRKVK